MGSRLMMKTYLWILAFGPCIIFSDAIRLIRTELEEENEQFPALNCPTGFILLGESCYAFGELFVRDWVDSQAYCASLAPGGKLIEIETAKEFYTVFTYLRENPPESCYSYWIGAEERFGNFFQWAFTRWPLMFYNWEYSYPRNTSSFRKAIVVDCRSDWQWSDYIKSHNHYQLCEVPPLQRTDMEEDKKQVRTLICPTGFTLLGESCYAFGEEYNMTWSQSKSYCGLLAPCGKLIEIETAEEFYTVFTYLRENPPESCYTYWTGAEERYGNYFHWKSTKWPLMFYNWKHSYPGKPLDWDARVISIECFADWQWNHSDPRSKYQLCEVPPTEVVQV